MIHTYIPSSPWIASSNKKDEFKKHFTKPHRGGHSAYILKRELCVVESFESKFYSLMTSPNSMYSSGLHLPQVIPEIQHTCRVVDNFYEVSYSNISLTI